MIPNNGLNYYEKRQLNRSSTPFKPTEIPQQRINKKEFNYDYDEIKSRLALSEDQLILCEEVVEGIKITPKKETKKPVMKRSLSALMEEANNDAHKALNNKVLFKSEQKIRETL